MTAVGDAGNNDAANHESSPRPDALASQAPLSLSGPENITSHQRAVDVSDAQLVASGTPQLHATVTQDPMNDATAQVKSQAQSPPDHQALDMEYGSSGAEAKAMSQTASTSELAQPRPQGELLQGAPDVFFHPFDWRVSVVALGAVLMIWSFAWMYLGCVWNPMVRCALLYQ